MLDGIAVTLLPPGDEPVDLTPRASDVRWSTAAVGGFGSCDFSLPMRHGRVPKLALVRVTHGPRVLFEGQVEDTGLKLTGGEWGSSVKALGLRRKLEQTSVRRIWLKRDLAPYTKRAFGDNGDILAHYDLSTGQYDLADQSKAGVKFAAIAGTTLANGQWIGAVYAAPEGMTLTRIRSHVVCSGTGFPSEWRPHIHDSTDGVVWNQIQLTGSSPDDFNEALTNGAKFIRLSLQMVASHFLTAGEVGEFYNIRLLGAVDEDSVGGATGGGLYGGTVLRDLIPLVPDIQIGTVESGSDFAIESIDRSVRASALTVVDEVAMYYDREWAVWEDGRFDWKTVDRDQAQWLLSTDEIETLDLNESVDQSVRTIYLAYLDAISFLSKEESATSTLDRNPFVKQGKTKDATAQVSFPMTPNSAQQLASKLARDQGGYPPVQGKIVLPASAQVAHATGAPLPAFCIRAGENVTISDLPASVPLGYGRDGETLFHVVSTEANEKTGRVTLEVEGYHRRSSILLARLANATRSITG